MIGAMPLPRDSWVRFGAVSGVLFVCALLLGWTVGETPVPRPRPPAPIPWTLPRLRTTDPAKDFTIVSARRPWSAGFGSTPKAAADHQPAAIKTWRLAGIVHRGMQNFALVATGTAAAAKLAYLRVGDRLPDGSILVRIMADGAVTKEPNSSPRVYRLFGSKEE